MLDLRRLRYFLAIAEHGSLSAAARALNVAQPALSYHLAEMERTFGLALVRRGNKGVRLTEDGAVLQAHAADIVRRADRMEAEMAARGKRKTPVVPSIRLAIITSLAAALTPLLAQRLRQADAEGALALSIVETGTREIQTGLSRGQIDIGLCLAAGPGYSAETIAAEELVLLAPAGTPARAALPLAALAGWPLVLPARGNPLRDFLEARAKAAGIALDVVLEVDGFTSRLNSVATGIGATLVGANPIPATVRDHGLCAMPFAGRGLVRPLYLGRRKGLEVGVASQIGAIMADALAEIGLAPPAAVGGPPPADVL